MESGLLGNGPETSVKRRGRKPKLGPEIVPDVIDKYVTQKWSRKQLARHFGVSEFIVKRYLKLHKITKESRASSKSVVLDHLRDLITTDGNAVGGRLARAKLKRRGLNVSAKRCVKLLREIDPESASVRRQRFAPPGPRKAVGRKGISAVPPISQGDRVSSPKTHLLPLLSEGATLRDQHFVHFSSSDAIAAADVQALPMDAKPSQFVDAVVSNAVRLQGLRRRDKGFLAESVATLERALYLAAEKGDRFSTEDDARMAILLAVFRTAPSLSESVVFPVSLLEVLSDSHLQHGVFGYDANALRQRIEDFLTSPLPRLAMEEAIADVGLGQAGFRLSGLMENIAAKLFFVRLRDPDVRSWASGRAVYINMFFWESRAPSLLSGRARDLDICVTGAVSFTEHACLVLSGNVNFDSHPKHAGKIMETKMFGACVNWPRISCVWPPEVVDSLCDVVRRSCFNHKLPIVDPVVLRKQLRPSSLCSVDVFAVSDI